MSESAVVVEPAEATLIEPPDVRLVPAGQPAGPVIEALLTALRQGTISPKLGREMLVRLVPPAKPTVKLKLPRIVDSASYALACQRITAAAAAGRVAPGDAAILLRMAKGTHESLREVAKARLRLMT